MRGMQANGLGKGIARAAALAIAASACWLPPGAAVAQDMSSLAVALSPFRQAIAAAASRDQVLATFYQARDYKPLWTGYGDAGRRQAFFAALSHASENGLPVGRYDPAGLLRGYRNAWNERDRGTLEVEMSAAFLRYAHDMQSGVLDPDAVDPDIKRQAPRRDPLATLQAFAQSSPDAFIRLLAPQNPAYARLLKAKLDLEQVIAEGGWGPEVAGGKIGPGDSGPEVVALRNRLIAMGYLGRTASPDYDDALTRAVRLFQHDHGLLEDGIAGDSTLAAVNVGAIERLKSIVVALERLRWMNMPLGKRHVWVNEAAFTAEIVDDGKVTFKTRAIVGKDGKDTRSPEFSDQIEFMVVNPAWNVPRSIMAKEYLPKLKKDPDAVKFLEVVDAQGKPIDRSSIDFSEYTAKTFPYELKQPPSDDNALGRVKFMFPNRYNIYLHDTPTKSLFQRTVRDFSHGCIRLHKPFGFAYTLLAPQTDDPQGEFQAALDSGKKKIIMLKKPVPVHLVYFTAWPSARTGRMTYRRDIYGRDAEIFAALAKAGVALRAVQG